MTTIKSNVNDELLQLLNKYCPPKNKSQPDINEKSEENSVVNSVVNSVANSVDNSVENSLEQISKSNDNIKTSHGSVASEGSKYVSSSESSSDTEKENIMEDSFLPSRVNKKLTKEGGSAKSSNENVGKNDAASKISKNDSQSNHHQPSISSSVSSSKSKSGKKSKKHKLKGIFSPIHRIFNTNSNVSSPRKVKSNENINKVGQSDTYTNDTVEDESKYRCEEVLGKGAVST